MLHMYCLCLLLNLLSFEVILGDASYPVAQEEVLTALWRPWEPLPRGRSMAQGFIWKHYALIVGGKEETDVSSIHKSPEVLWIDVEYFYGFAPLSVSELKFPSSMFKTIAQIGRHLPAVCHSCVHITKEGLVFNYAADLEQGGDEMLLLRLHAGSDLTAEIVKLSRPQLPRRGATFVKWKYWDFNAPIAPGSTSMERINEEMIEYFILLGGVDPVTMKPISLIERYDSSSGEWSTLPGVLPNLRWSPNGNITSRDTKSFCGCSTFNAKKDIVALYGCFDCEAVHLGVIPLIVKYNTTSQRFLQTEEKPQDARNPFFYDVSDSQASRSSSGTVWGSYVVSVNMQDGGKSSNNDTDTEVEKAITQISLYDINLEQSLQIQTEPMNRPRIHCALFSLGVNIVCAGGMLYAFNMSSTAVPDSSFGQLFPALEAHWAHNSGVYYVSEAHKGNESVNLNLTNSASGESSGMGEDGAVENDLVVYVRDCMSKAAWLRLAADGSCSHPLPGVSDQHCAPVVRFSSYNNLFLRQGESIEAYLCFSYGSCNVETSQRKLCTLSRRGVITNVEDCLAQPCCWDEITQTCYSHEEPSKLNITRRISHKESLVPPHQMYVETTWIPVRMQPLTFTVLGTSKPSKEWARVFNAVAISVIFLLVFGCPAIYCMWRRIVAKKKRRSNTDPWNGKSTDGTPETPGKDSLAMGLLKNEHKSRCADTSLALPASSVPFPNDGGVEVLGRQYCVLRRIGGSSHSSVYLARRAGCTSSTLGARDVYTEKDGLVVLKVIPCRDSKERVQAIQEFDLLLKLTHPHIIRVHDAVVVWNPRQSLWASPSLTGDSVLLALSSYTQSTFASSEKFKRSNFTELHTVSQIPPPPPPPPPLLISPLVCTGSAKRTSEGKESGIGASETIPVHTECCSTHDTALFSENRSIPPLSSLLHSATVSGEQTGEGNACDSHHHQHNARAETTATGTHTFVLNGLQFVCFVMDYYPLGDTASHLRKRLVNGGTPTILPERLLWSWAHQLASALASLHLRKPPITHGDIKPENIFLTAEDHLLLADFGCAFHSAAGRRSGGTDQRCAGTAPFMAPEIVRGQQARPDPAADMWAMGCTLFAWSTGRVRSDDTVFMFSAIDQRGFEDTFLKEELADYSREWCDLVSGLLRVEAAERLTAEGVLSLTTVLLLRF